LKVKYLFADFKNMAYTQIQGFHAVLFRRHSYTRKAGKDARYRARFAPVGLFWRRNKKSTLSSAFSLILQVKPLLDAKMSLE
jgi:hypothetical protein